MADPSGDNSSGQRPSGQRGGKPGEEQRRGTGPTTLIIILLVLIALFFAFSGGAKRGDEVTYSFFWRQLKAENVESVTIHGEMLSGKWRKIPDPPKGKSGTLSKEFHAVLLSPYTGDSNLSAELERQADLPGDDQLIFDAERQTMSRSMELLTYMSVPLIFLFFLWLMMRRSADPFSGGMMGGFIRSPARKFERSEEPVTYNDVAGLKSPQAGPAGSGRVSQESKAVHKNRGQNPERCAADRPARDRQDPAGTRHRR